MHGSDDAREASQALAQYGSLGCSLAAGVAVFAGVGWWLDEQLGTAPVCLSVLCLLGAAGSLGKLIRDVSRLNGDEQEAGSGHPPDSSHR